MHKERERPSADGVRRRLAEIAAGNLPNVPNVRFCILVR